MPRLQTDFQQDVIGNKNRPVCHNRQYEGVTWAYVNQYCLIVSSNAKNREIGVVLKVRN